ISAASKYNRIRHYRKLDKMEWILKENLELYDCVSVAGHLGLQEEFRVQSSEFKVSAPVEVISNRKSQTETTDISIVIPCYNEQEALPYLANTLRAVETNLRQNGYRTNFIFVDDKSKDNTLGVLNDLFGKQKNAKILRHETHKGVAAGIMSSLR